MRIFPYTRVGQNRQKVFQLQNMAGSAETAKIAPVGPEKGRKIKKYFLRKFAIFQSLMKETARWHGFLHIRAHLVAKGALGQMGQIQPVSTCI